MNRAARLIVSVLLCTLCLTLMSCGLFEDPNGGKKEAESILSHWNEEKNALVITLSDNESFVFYYDFPEDNAFCYLGEWNKDGNCFPAVLYRESGTADCGFSFERAPDAWSYGYSIHRIMDLPAFLARARGYTSEFWYMDSTEWIAQIDYNVGENLYTDADARKTASVLVEQRKAVLGFINPAWSAFSELSDGVAFTSDKGRFTCGGSRGIGTWEVGDRSVRIRVEFVPETAALLIYDISGDAPKQILFAVGELTDENTFAVREYTGTMFYAGSLDGFTVEREAPESANG